MPRYAITDIHGCAKTFKKMLAELNFSQKDKLYLLGDYIDRGPDSKGVLDHILDLQSSGYEVHCLKGNHEEKILLSRHDINQSRNWLTWGGKETLESFGVDKINDIDNKYLEWMEALPNIIELPQLENLLDEDQERAQYLDLDNGCVFQKEGKHQLCAFNMDAKTLYFMENVE